MISSFGSGIFEEKNTEKVIRSLEISVTSESIKVNVINYKEKNQFPISNYLVVLCNKSYRYKPLAAAFLVLFPFAQVLVCSPATVRSFPPLSAKNIY